MAGCATSDTPWASSKLFSQSCKAIASSFWTALTPGIHIPQLIQGLAFLRKCSSQRVVLVRLRVIGPAGAPIFVNVSKIDDGLVAALSHGHLVKMLCLIVILPYESPPGHGLQFGQAPRGRRSGVPGWPSAPAPRGPGGVATEDARRSGRLTGNCRARMPRPGNAGVAGRVSDRPADRRIPS